MDQALKLLGPRLKQYREEAQISVPTVAKAVGVGRQYIYSVESGSANFNIDTFVKYLRACGVPFTEFLRGMQLSDIPTAHQRPHQMLSTILKADIPKLTDGIEVNLEAISEKAVRLQRARDSNPKAGSSSADNLIRHEKKKKAKPAQEAGQRGVSLR